ncbi:hypothetical protein MTP99_000520 [Tenebrio molitor]|jgi:hypothetical protein|nr:hypothetical protein MTP99_000520 [Tenebrio molitor]CAH1364141.1 unnamed protein product [Tenebrio molitor]
MKYHHLVLLCIHTFVLIFCVNPAFSDSDAKVTILSKQDDSSRPLHFKLKHNIVLKCNSTGNGEIKWAKGDKLVTEIEELKGRIEVSTKSDNTSTLVLKEAKDSDAGNYTCSLYDGDSKMASDTIRVAATTTGKWGLRVNKNVNVVEGEKLTLKCEVKGDLKLDWLYKNITSGENYTELVERDRITIKNYETDDDEKITIENGQVDIEDAKMMDRGIYLCRGIANDGEIYNASSTVRVKDKYAALWPFLGICAEVLVLCAIIVVYEKKRNKTELEESDTDQSPDQKNTPDHGKESNLRHRQ